MSRISTGVFQQFSGIADEGLAYNQATLPLWAIDPHPANRPIDPDKVQKLAATIERDGLGQLPLVRALPNGRYQMIAGHHRLEAYRHLAEKTGDSRWKSIPVDILQDCDDERALCLLHMTNLVAPDLDKAEIGRAYEAIAAIIDRERKANPDKFAGVLTNRIVANISAEQGRPVGITFVKDARKAYRESAGVGRANGRAPYRRPSESVLAADAMQRAIERIEALDGDGLAPIARRLARYEQRLEAIVRRCPTD